MQVDTLILGAGAAGLMCAAQCQGRTLVIDHARKAGEKIRISGGGRCNFTNLGTSAENFISQNPHFAKSALARYSQWDFIDRVDRAGIAWHEKTLGQLFCDGKSQQIIDMLLADCAAAGADVWVNTKIAQVVRDGSSFVVTVERPAPVTLSARNLVVATGGKSIPKMGATGLGYSLAQDFGLPIVETRPALVPLTFGEQFAALSGVAVQGAVTANGTRFDEAVLFTHRGLSGPAVLQASSYWSDGDPITVHAAPAGLYDALRNARSTMGRKSLGKVLATQLPERLCTYILGARTTDRIGDQSDAKLMALVDQIQNWHLTPSGSEGYRTAEVTAGGVDTDALHASTLEAKTVPNLFFIGEVVDVTGWLGGYNFQWAWSSGAAAARAINTRV